APLLHGAGGEREGGKPRKQQSRVIPDAAQREMTRRRSGIGPPHPESDPVSAQRRLAPQRARDDGLLHSVFHHPTRPSRLTLTSFCASTANSIGSSCSTSLQKPLTRSATDSSSESPRL